jgi:tripartite-type tricarboxylate transporter receptor subunit TctC
VKAAEPDGHTLLLGTGGMMTMFPNAYRKLSYDPMKDFVPIVNAASFELAMVINSSVPAGNLAEFIAWAKTQGPNGERSASRRTAPAPRRTFSARC